MKASYLLASGLFLVAVSCERHEWEDTKVLHETHGEHDDHGDHEEHGDEEDDSGDDH